MRSLEQRNKNKCWNFYFELKKERRTLAAIHHFFFFIIIPLFLLNLYILPIRIQKSVCSMLQNGRKKGIEEKNGNWFDARYRNKNKNQSRLFFVVNAIARGAKKPCRERN